jgi:hypothetical protein
MAAPLLTPVLFRPKRKLGPFTAQVTFSEEHTDELTLTQHPVEQGAAITDHAYKNPARLTIRCGFSQSSVAGLVSTARTAASALAAGDVRGALGGFFGPDYLQDIYRKLLDLQAGREPFDIVTGKRKYQNMLIVALATTTDEATENVLAVTVTCQEVIIVETQAAALPPAADQAEPEKTAAPVNSGSQQLAPAPQVNQSALAALAGIGG